MIEEMALQEAKREQQRSQNTYSKSSNSSSFDYLTCCLLCWIHILHEISHSYYHQSKDIWTTVQYQGFGTVLLLFLLIFLLMAATSDNSTTSELL